MAIVQFLVDISEVTESLQLMNNLPHYVLTEVANQVEQEGRLVLLSAFEEAMQHQSYDSFPEEFRDHVREVVSNVKFDKIIEGSAFSVSFDFNQLGTRQDLERAFHQGALLADGKTRLDGPYTGQALKNDANDPHKTRNRHIYWLAVHRGDTRAPNPERPGTVPVESGAWERTKRKYVEIWGDKAPQWLYLQFGQNKWDPTILGFPIIETFNQTFITNSGDLFNSLISDQIQEAQRHGAVFTPHGARLTQTTNEIGPSGKIRRPGQFYPLR